MKRDYYKILGLHPNATDEDIKQAYRNEAKKWHPDINTDDDATSKMKEINEAYYVLSDSGRRTEFNAIFERNDTGETDSKYGSTHSPFDYDSIFNNWAQKAYSYSGYPDIEATMKLRQKIFDMLDGKANSIF